MQHRFSTQIVLLFLSMVLVVSACSTFSPPPTPTHTPQPTATHTLVPTATLTPTLTPRPTATPNMTATQKAEAFQAEVQSYFDQGYLETTDGSVEEFPEFVVSWAKLGWYYWQVLGEDTENFFMSAHLTWSSAYRTADISGCGFAFAVQPNWDHYAVFLDRSQVFFVQTDYYYNPFSPTRGTGRVKFDNPFDHPVEADLTLIVNGTTAYVLVDEALVGQYTLAESRILKGDLGLAVLSGTNRGFGTRCAMSNIHVWTPK